MEAPASTTEAHGRVDDESLVRNSEESVSYIPIYRVTLMSWCFQFMLDLLWIPLAAYFRDLDLNLSTLGAVFACNLGVRIIPNAFATRLGVKTDLICMSCGFLSFAVNLAYPTATWAICVMSAGGGMTFVRAHLAVHGKVAASGSKEMLTLAAKWCGAARNAGTVVAFAVPVLLYEHFGWSSVLVLAMVVMALYLSLAVVQHSTTDEQGVGSTHSELSAGLVEEAPAKSIPWIDWVMAGAFCVTELQMNVQAAAIPTTLMRTFGVPMPLVGGIQAVGQLVAMGFLVLLSKGFIAALQKRPLNLVLSFFGTFLAMTAIWLATLTHVSNPVIIVLSLYFFYISAYTAQVTMLECLMGVLDMQNSIIVMGIAEMFGCACSLVGGYLGPALLEVDPAAPFALQVSIAMLTTGVLGFCLGHRAWTQLVVCEMETQYDESMRDMISRRPSISKSLKGLKQMSQRPESYIGVEQAYRKHSSDTSRSVLAPVASSGSLFCPDEVQPQTPQALAETLLTSVPARKVGHRRCSSESVPIPDMVASTHEARHFKKVLVSFDLAYLSLDTHDYVIEPSAVKELVVTHQVSHRRSRSVM